MVDLFGQLLLTQLVQREKFACQLHVVDEATTGQLHPDDDLAVRDHHGYAAEVDLQVLGQLLATCVTWILDDRENGIVHARCINTLFPPCGPNFTQITFAHCRQI